MPFADVLYNLYSSIVGHCDNQKSCTSHQDLRIQHSRLQLEGRVQTVPMQNCNKAASMSWQVNQEQQHSVVPIAQSLAAACLTPASVNAKIMSPCASCQA